MEFDKVADLLKGVNEFGLIDNAVIIAHIDPNAGHLTATPRIAPEKNDGMIVILVLDGSVEMEINLEGYRVEANSLVIVPPDAVFMSKRGSETPGNAYLLYISRDFLPEINVNYTAMSMPMGEERPSHVVTFTPDQVRQLQRIFDTLLHSTSFKVDTSLDRNVTSSLISAMIYQIAQFYIKALEPSKEHRQEHSRPSGYVHEFIHLLQIHYAKERSVAFYASKLFISPKYLSLLVKKATGRSASRWIDDRVILEARNLLRFSGKNVQQVAYMLNFSNQSSFGKYFKHLTGMSPTEYQKS